MKEVLFASIDTLREELHEPEPLEVARREPIPQSFTVSLPSLGSQKLDLAKEAFLRHGFSYLRADNDIHHWTQTDKGKAEMEALLWERDNTVWVRAVTADVGLPMEDTLITDVWEDTGILPRIPAAGLPVSEKVLTIRAGKLSPLAIKRPSPVLEKPKGPEKVYENLEDNIDQIQRAVENDTRIIGLTIETGSRNNYAVESHLLKQGTVSFSAEHVFVKEAVQYFQRHNLPAPIYWRNHDYLWNQVKDIPVDIRMATPFEHGNVCEDADRCLLGRGERHRFESNHLSRVSRLYSVSGARAICRNPLHYDVPRPKCLLSRKHSWIQTTQQS